MPRTLSLLAIVIALLAGCTAPMEYRFRPTRSDANSERDRYECLREAAGVPQVAPPGGGGPPTYPTRGGFAEGYRYGQATSDYHAARELSERQEAMQTQLFAMCMRNRGYVLEQVSTASTSPSALEPFRDWTAPRCRGEIPVRSPWDDELRAALTEIRTAASEDLWGWTEIAIAAAESHSGEPRVCQKDGRATITIPVVALRALNTTSGRGYALRFLVARELARIAQRRTRDPDGRAAYYLVRAGYDCIEAASVVSRLGLRQDGDAAASVASGCAVAKRGQRP